MDSFAVTLETPDGTRRIDCASGEFIWNAAARHGIVLPSICHQGRCLTCAGRVLAGDFDQSAAASYYPADRGARFILLCTAWPLGPMVIRTHQQWEMRRHRREHGLPAPYG